MDVGRVRLDASLHSHLAGLTLLRYHPAAGFTLVGNVTHHPSSTARRTMFPEDLSWRGATLVERLAHVRGSAENEAAKLANHTRCGVSQNDALIPWARACAQGDLDALFRRLSWDGIDAQVASAAMAHEAPDDFPVARWVDYLPEFVMEARECASAIGTPEWDAEVAEVGTEAPFVDVWMPVLRAARRRLPSTVPFFREWFSEESIGALERQLLKEISRLGELALHEDFRTESGRGEASPFSDRYQPYVRDVLASRYATILGEYPVLARQAVLLVDQWVDQIGELAFRLEADRTAIESTFGRPAGKLSRLTPGLSDRHAGAGRVALVEFASGLRLAYKPRDVRLECAFNECLAWLRQRGLAVSRPLLTIDRETYGWLEWVEQDGFASRASAQAYFRSAGALVCLASVLGATDLHSENLIASSAGPALVDTEMLLQPVSGARAVADASDGDDSPRASSDSCLASGLVSAIVVDKSGEAFDVGGLRHAESRELSVPTRLWHNLRRDDIGFVPGHRIHPVLRNDVRVDGGVCRPEQFVDEICAGFEQTYHFLESNRAELLADEGPLTRLATCRTRVLFRPSDQYAAAQYVMASPRFQRRGLDRSLAIETFNRVFAFELERPRIWPLVHDEREALERLDIPRQTLLASTTDLTASTGEVVQGYYAVSGIDGVRSRLAALSTDDLTYQLDLLRTALARHDAFSINVRTDQRTSEGDHLRAAAERVGRAVLARAHEGADGSLRWLSDSGQGDLYAGAGGIGLFFAALAAVTRRDEWRDAARRTLRSIDAVASGAQDSSEWRIGGCTGRPSVAYAVALAGHLVEDDRLVGQGAELASSIPFDAIDRDVLLDIEGGAAGALVALLAVNELRSDDRLRTLAARCVARLVATQLHSGPDRGGWRAGIDAQPRPGFAHGAAGIAFALCRWAESCHDQGVAGVVRDAWDFERRMVSGGGLWPAIGANGRRLAMAAWCHGAPGIALARAFAPATMADRAVAAEVEEAMSQTLAAPPSQFDHLCCGNLGRADVALTVGRRMATVKWVEAGLAAARGVAERVLSQGRLGMRGRGFQNGAATPAFLLGLSGIGYQLLRAASPSRLPSVLAFQAPTVQPAENR